MDEEWLAVWSVIRQEFSDLPSIAELARVCLRLFMAIILGGVLGYERESAGASAGFRTHMLVALGSALFVLVPLQGGMEMDDMSRVLQGVIAGIGFLGAGAIIKMGQEPEIRGLTTAASIWLTSAVGIAAGMGRELTAIVSTLFGLMILLLVRLIGKPRHAGESARRQLKDRA